MSEERRKIVTCEGRLAFGRNIFETNEKGRFTLAVVFDQTDENKACLDDMQNLVDETAKMKWAKKPSNFKSPMKVENREDMLEKYQFMKDRVTVNLSNGNAFPVGTKDEEGMWVDITDKDLKSGDYVQVVLTAYFYDNATKGVGFNVDALLKTKDGEAFYSKRTGADMFGLAGVAEKPKTEAYDNFGF